jgi:cell division protein FtsB
MRPIDMNDVIKMKNLALFEKLKNQKSSLEEQSSSQMNLTNSIKDLKSPNYIS